jgi:hypothetical protein
LSVRAEHFDGDRLQQVAPLVNLLHRFVRHLADGALPDQAIYLTWTNVRKMDFPVARWFIFIPKIPIWVYFGGPWNGKCWYSLGPF